MNKKNNNIISFKKIILKIFPMTFKTFPMHIFLLILISLLHGTSFALITVFTQKFLDSMSSYVNGNINIIIVLKSLGLLCMVVIYSQVLNGVSNFTYNELPKKIRCKIERKINLKSSKLDPIDFEDPLLLDSINKAKNGLESAIKLMFLIIMILTSYIPYIIFMEIYLYRLNHILAISIILIFVPIFVAQCIKIKIYSNLEDKVAPRRREYEYYEKCIEDREYFKETRLLGAFSYFRKIYKESLNELNVSIWNSEKKSGFFEIIMKIITLVGYSSVLILLMFSLLNRSITIGAFGALFSSISSIFNMVEEIVCKHIASIVQSLGSTRNFLLFLDIPERNGKLCFDIKSSDIVLDNISFKYPAAKKNSLNNISLKINENETIAIVGENGAGKSTLVKVIIGLYIPTEGTVFIGKANTREVDQECLYKNISGVFQKYQRYKMTLKDNIAISDTKIEENLKNIKSAVNKADLEVKREIFPYEYDTMLSKEFDGIDLSGGQWQRIAIARGFYRKHNIIVLDEPTASIDPVEETNIYKKFNDISQGKTSIIVTHRLGSAKIADRIIVMDKGEIVQIGTHNELINIDGKYKSMYEMQSKWYKEA